MTDMLSPFWYGVSIILVVPIFALCLMLFALVLLVMWPILPFMGYYLRKAELDK